MCRVPQFFRTVAPKRSISSTDSADGLPDRGLGSRFSGLSSSRSDGLLPGNVIARAASPASISGMLGAESSLIAGGTVAAAGGGTGALFAIALFTVSLYNRQQEEAGVSVSVAISSHFIFGLVNRMVTIAARRRGEISRPVGIDVNKSTAGHCAVLINSACCRTSPLFSCAAGLCSSINSGSHASRSGGCLWSS